MIDTNVSLAPQNCVSLLLNMDGDVEIGSAVSRLGRGTVGAQITASNSILGLHQHIDVDTPANNKLFAAINASGGATEVIYDVDSAANSVTGLTASKKMRFLTYLGATLAINGADGERSYTSAGWITTGGAFDLANIPSSNKVNLCIEFLDRVYLAGDTAALTRLYYSSVPVSGAVSWTSGNGYVDIEPEDGGGPITALGKVPGYVLVFKERSMHRWNFSSAFPESLIQIGTPSQESVVMGGGLCAFYSNSNESSKGFYITNGDRPVCISQDNNRPIKKFVDAISSSNEANIAGWATDNSFAWSVGDLTVDGETFSNAVLRYNRLLNQWSIRTYPSKFLVFAQYLLSGVNTTVGGDNNGTVYRMDKPSTFLDGNTSTTQSFPWKVRQLHQTFSENKQKSLNNKVIVRGKNIGSARVNAYVDEVIEPKPVGAKVAVGKSVGEFGVSGTVKGNTIALEVSGESSGARSYVREIEADIELLNSYA